MGVGADSASSSHTNHMAALNTDHSADEHRNLVNNKNKGSPQDGSVAKKLKKVSFFCVLRLLKDLEAVVHTDETFF